MALRLIRSAILASLTIASVAFADGPFYEKAEKDLGVKVVEHSFPAKFGPGVNKISMKIKNTSEFALRGALAVELVDAQGKKVRDLGSADIDIPPAKVSDVELDLPVSVTLTAKDVNKRVRIVLSNNIAGSVECYSGAVSADAAVKKADGEKKDTAKKANIKHEIKYIKHIRKGEAAQYRDFLESGGVLIMPLIASSNDFAGVVEFCGDAGEKGLPTWKAQKGAAHSYDQNVRPGAVPLFDWPNLISRDLSAGNNRLSLSGPANKLWKTVQGNYTVMLRVGAGMLILSTHTCADTKELRENIAAHFMLEKAGFQFVSFEHKYERLEDYKGPAGEPQMGGGTTTFKVKNFQATNLLLAAKMTFTPLDGGRATRMFMHRRRASNKLGEDLEFKIAVPPLEIHGKYRVKTELFNWNTKESWTMDDREIVLPDLIEVVPPDYRSTVSTKRADPNVFIGIKANRKRIDMGGMSWKMVAKNAKGKVVASDEGKFAAGTRFTEAALPMGKDAPAGTYAVEAEVELPCGNTVVAKGEFIIVAPEKGQIIIDQDGFLLNEGEPYFPLGIYHCHTFDWERPVKDGSGLRPCDIGFNWMQMWGWDWDHHLSLRPEVVGKFIRDREGKAFDEALAATLETNKLNRAMLKRDGVVICYEGFGFWESSFLELRGPKGLYKYMKEEHVPQEIKWIADDPDQLVRMWYFADEAGGHFYHALNRAHNFVRANDKHYHPGFNLGNFPAVMSSDMGGNDIYVRYYGGLGEARSFTERVEEMRRMYAPYRRRPFVVPQAFGQSKSQNSETPEWVRFESYISIIHGANGLGFYCWTQTGDWSGKHAQGMGWNPVTAHAVKKIISEIKVFELALRVPGQKNFRSLDGQVDALLCGDEKTGRFLIACSVCEFPVDTALQIKGIGKSKLEPLFGAPKAEFNGDDELKFKLPQWGTAVWKIK